MATGLCLLVLEDGTPHSVQVEYSKGWEVPVDLVKYKMEGYQPPWWTLSPCPGQPPVGRGFLPDVQTRAVRPSTKRKVEVQPSKTEQGDQKGKPEAPEPDKEQPRSKKDDK